MSRSLGIPHCARCSAGYEGVLYLPEEGKSFNVCTVNWNIHIRFCICRTSLQTQLVRHTIQMWHTVGPSSMNCCHAIKSKKCCPIRRTQRLHARICTYIPHVAWGHSHALSLHFPDHCSIGTSLCGHKWAGERKMACGPINFSNRERMVLMTPNKCKLN